MDGKNEGGVKDAAAYLVKLGEEKIAQVHDDGRTVWMQTPGGIRDYRKVAAVPGRSHALHSLASLVDYVTGPFCDASKTTVFVSREKLYGDCRYGTDETQRLTMPLALSPEYVALQKLFAGVGQKDLWRLLVTDLAQALDPGLVLAIGSLERATKGSDVGTVDATTGLVSGSREFAVSVVSKGVSQEVKLQPNYLFSGPLVTAIEGKYEIGLRLDMDSTDRGLVFRFHPIGLDRVWQSLLEDMAGMIRDQVPEIGGVYLGKYEG